MDSRGVDRGQVRTLSHEWASFFSQPQTEACHHENTPFWAKSDLASSITGKEIIEALMSDLCDDSEPYLYQAVELRGFCLQANLEILKAGTDERVTKPVAILDDRNYEGITRTNPGGTCRPWKGALSAHRLYRELCKMVNRRIITLRDIF